jgi:hypothetical protein
MEIDYLPIERKIKELLKQKIEKEGLVASGKLLNSIEVHFKNGSLEIIAEDYYKYLDEEHGLTDFLIYSEELADFIENYLATEIEKQIK